jgi:hypothetical protein
MRRLFALAALVMFVFALIAFARTGTLFTTSAFVWLSAGFVALAADQVLSSGLTRTV